MTKKLNSFKNIITVLMALLLLGIAVGPASAAITSSGPGGNVTAGLPGQNVGNIILTSNSNYDFAVQIKIMPPTGLTFNTSSPFFFAAKTGNITIGTPTLTASLITVPVNSASTALDTVTVGGIMMDVAATASGGSNSFTVQSAGATSSNPLINVVVPTLTEVADNIPAGVRSSSAGTITVAAPTLNGVIGNGTTINVTLPSSSGITFDRSAAVTTTNWSTTLNVTTPATISADGLTLSTMVINGSTVGDIMTFTGVKLNATGAAVTGTQYNVTTSVSGGSPVTVKDTNSVNAISVIKPILGEVVDNIAKGGNSFVANTITVTAPTVVSIIGAGTTINITLPSSSGITFDRSATVTTTNGSTTLNVTTPATISADGLTLSTTVINGSTAGDSMTFTGIQLNATATAVSAQYNVTTKASATGDAVTVKNGTTSNKINVIVPTVTNSTTVYLDNLGFTHISANNFAVNASAVVAGVIGNGTFINVTLTGTGITFDKSATVAITNGTTLNVTTPATISSDGLTLSTRVINGSAANDNVTFTGVKLNITTSATTQNYTVITTPSGTGAATMTTVSTAQIVISPITADAITLTVGNLTPSVGTENTYSFNVKNTTQVQNFGGQQVDFTKNSSLGTFNVTSAITDSSGNVYVNFTAPATITTLNITATIRGTANQVNVTLTPVGAAATKLAIFQDIPKLAPTGIATITVKAQDSLGNNVSSTDTVRLAVSGDAYITSNVTVVMSAGVATFTVQKTTPGSTTLTATDTTGTLIYATGTQVFTADIGSIVLTSSTTSLTVNGSVANLSVQLFDVNGNVLALQGQMITITSSNTSLATVGTATPTTNVSGIALSNLTSTNVTGTIIVKATVTNQTGVKLWSNVSVSIVPAAAHDIMTYYRGLHGSPTVVDDADLISAANDWSNDVIPTGFTAVITDSQLISLANEWSSS